MNGVGECDGGRMIREPWPRWQTRERTVRIHFKGVDGPVFPLAPPVGRHRTYANCPDDSSDIAVTAAGNTLGVSAFKVPVRGSTPKGDTPPLASPT